MSAVRFWVWLTWLESPIVTRRRAERQAKAAFRLGVDAGATGLLNDSAGMSQARRLFGLSSDVIEGEVPPH